MLYHIAAIIYAFCVTIGGEVIHKRLFHNLSDLKHMNDGETEQINTHKNTRKNE